jgi:ParB-like nuclease domain
MLLGREVGSMSIQDEGNMAAKIREVPIESCLEIPEGYLTPYDPSIEKLDLMARSIKQLGIVQPLIVNNTFHVIDGRNRWKGAEQAGLKRVWVHVVDVPNVARPVELQIMFNQGISKVALSKGFERICAVLTKVTIPELEPRVGMHAREIMKVLNLKFASEDITRDVRLGTICLPNACGLSKIHPYGHEQQFNFLDRAKKMESMEFLPLVVRRLKELKDARPKAKHSGS